MSRILIRGSGCGRGLDRPELRRRDRLARRGRRKDQRDKEIARLGEYTGQSFLVLGAVSALASVVKLAACPWGFHVVMRPTAITRYSPSLETAFTIARVFAVPLEQVFQYSDDEGTAP
ncbi:hypothetical protein [Streptomyces sp. NPDC056387]|uniref:hypothetical protein n=1 Tax=Streptomyces sp. NPDC056387 TaxID=3345803 RepID=UPI0035DFEE5F